MAMPKKGASPHKTKTRRSQIKLSIASVTTCESCGSIKLPHRICKVCGRYNGAQVLDVDKKNRKAAARKRIETHDHDHEETKTRIRESRPAEEKKGLVRGLIQRTTSK